MKHSNLESRFIIFRKLSEEQMRDAMEQARKNGRKAEIATERALKIRGIPYYPPRQNYK